MAENYVQFSEGIYNITDEEEVWIRRHFESFDDAPDDPEEWKVWRRTYDMGDDGPDFLWRILEEDGGKILWLYAEESGLPEDVASFVKLFFLKFRPDECFIMAYSASCSKPRIGEFGGGSIFVTATEYHYVDASMWGIQKRAQWKKRRAKKSA